MSVKKMLLLAVVAVLAAMSMASAASATTRVTCGAGVTCASSQTFNGINSGNPTLTGGAFGNLTCTGSYMKGALNGTNPSASSVTATVTELHFSGCSSTSSCYPNVHDAHGNPGTILVSGISWDASILATTSTTGDLTINGVTVPFTMSGPCGTLNCHYQGSGTNNSVTGVTNNADSSVTFTSAGLTNVGDFACPGGTWDAKYITRTGTTVGSGTLVTIDNA